MCLCVCTKNMSNNSYHEVLRYIVFTILFVTFFLSQKLFICAVADPGQEPETQLYNEGSIHYAVIY